MEDCIVSEIRICNKCKNERELNSNNFYKCENRSKGFHSICIACKNEQNRNRYTIKGNEIKEYARQYYKNNTAKSLRNSYKNSDLKKNWKNDLDEEFIQEKLKEVCTYCQFPSTGLDRLDNNLPHIKSNCIPCCMECNVARNNHFTYEEMLILGKAIREIKLNRLKI